LLRGSAETLHAFGFGQVHLAGGQSNVEMAVCAVEKLFAENDIDRDEIGLILYATALSSSATMWNPSDAAGSQSTVLHLDQVDDLFKYPASRLQSELDLGAASVVGINQVGCASIFAALRMAGAMIADDSDLDSVLCVSADKFPPDAARDLVYNVVSDEGRTVGRRIAGERSRRGVFPDGKERDRANAAEGGADDRGHHPGDSAQRVGAKLGDPRKIDWRSAPPRIYRQHSLHGTYNRLGQHPEPADRDERRPDIER
jgi:hypothetical protein